MAERWEGAIGYQGIGIDRFDGETQELLKQVVKEYEEQHFKEKIAKAVERMKRHFLERGYSEEEIEVVKNYGVNVVYDFVSVHITVYVKTPHTYDYETYCGDVSLVSKHFRKERNEIGQRILERVRKYREERKMRDLERRIEELEGRIEELKEEKAKLKEIIRKLASIADYENELSEDEKEIVKSIL